MAGSGRKNADELLALSLAQGETMERAAANAGVSERTAYRRRQDPAFQARVIALRAELVEQALGKLSSDMSEAATTLKALLTAEAESVRLGAARSILELGTKMHDIVSIEQRLHELENRLQEPRGGTTKCIPRIADC